MKTLKRIAIYGGFLSLGGAIFISMKIEYNFRHEEYYTKSLELLRGYPPAVKLLGQPIRAKRLDLGDTTTTWSDGLSARLSVPVKGPKSKGTLHSWSSRERATDKWVVDKLDLEAEKRQNTFYINPDSRDRAKVTDPEDPGASEDFWKSAIDERQKNLNVLSEDKEPQVQNSEESQKLFYLQKEK